MPVKIPNECVSDESCRPCVRERGRTSERTEAKHCPLNDACTILRMKGSMRSATQFYEPSRVLLSDCDSGHCQNSSAHLRPIDCGRKHVPAPVIVPKEEQRAQTGWLCGLDAYIASPAREGTTEFNYVDWRRGARREPFFDLKAQGLLICAFHVPLHHSSSSLPHRSRRPNIVRIALETPLRRNEFHAAPGIAAES